MIILTQLNLDLIYPQVDVVEEVQEEGVDLEDEVEVEEGADLGVEVQEEVDLEVEAVDVVVAGEEADSKLSPATDGPNSKWVASTEWMPIVITLCQEQYIIFSCGFEQCKR